MTAKGGISAVTALRDPTGGYRPLPGVPDELVEPSGALRPGWAPLIRLLSGQTDDQLWDSEPVSKAGGSVHEPVCAFDQHDKAHDQ